MNNDSKELNTKNENPNGAVKSYNPYDAIASDAYIGSIKMGDIGVGRVGMSAGDRSFYESSIQSEQAKLRAEFESEESEMTEQSLIEGIKDVRDDIEFYRARISAQHALKNKNAYSNEELVAITSTLWKRFGIDTASMRHWRRNGESSYDQLKGTVQFLNDMKAIHDKYKNLKDDTGASNNELLQLYMREFATDDYNEYVDNVSKLPFDKKLEYIKKKVDEMENAKAIIKSAADMVRDAGTLNQSPTDSEYDWAISRLPEEEQKKFRSAIGSMKKDDEKTGVLKDFIDTILLSDGGKIDRKLVISSYVEDGESVPIDPNLGGYAYVTNVGKVFADPNGKFIDTLKEEKQLRKGFKEDGEYSNLTNKEVIDIVNKVGERTEEEQKKYLWALDAIGGTPNKYADLNGFFNDIRDAEENIEHLASSYGHSSQKVQMLKDDELMSNVLKNKGLLKDEYLNDEEFGKLTIGEIRSISKKVSESIRDKRVIDAYEQKMQSEGSRAYGLYLANFMSRAEKEIVAEALRGNDLERFRETVSVFMSPDRARMVMSAAGALRPRNDHGFWTDIFGRARNGFSHTFDYSIDAIGANFVSSEEMEKYTEAIRRQYEFNRVMTDWIQNEDNNFIEQATKGFADSFALQATSYSGGALMLSSSLVGAANPFVGGLLRASGSVVSAVGAMMMIGDSFNQMVMEGVPLEKASSLSIANGLIQYAIENMNIDKWLGVNLTPEQRRYLGVVGAFNVASKYKPGALYSFLKTNFKQGAEIVFSEAVEEFLQGAVDNGFMNVATNNGVRDVRSAVKALAKEFINTENYREGLAQFIEAIPTCTMFGVVGTSTSIQGTRNASLSSFHSALINRVREEMIKKNMDLNDKVQFNKAWKMVQNEAARIARATSGMDAKETAAYIQSLGYTGSEAAFYENAASQFRSFVEFEGQEFADFVFGGEINEAVLKASGMSLEHDENGNISGFKIGGFHYTVRVVDSNALQEGKVTDSEATEAARTWNETHEDNITAEQVKAMSQDELNAKFRVRGETTGGSVKVEVKDQNGNATVYDVPIDIKISLSKNAYDVGRTATTATLPHEYLHAFIMQVLAGRSLKNGGVLTGEQREVLKNIINATGEEKVARLLESAFNVAAANFRPDVDVVSVKNTLGNMFKAIAHGISFGKYKPKYAQGYVTKKFDPKVKPQLFYDGDVMQVDMGVPTLGGKVVDNSKLAENGEMKNIEGLVGEFIEPLVKSIQYGSDAKEDVTEEDVEAVVEGVVDPIADAAASEAGKSDEEAQAEQTEAEDEATDEVLNGEKDDGKGNNGEVDLLLEERNRVRDELRKAQGNGDNEAIKKAQERLTAINSEIRERAMMREGSADKSQFSTAVEQAQQEYEDVYNRYHGTDMWMKAPNGKPTNLTERQWVQVRTPAFKHWFGDWETLAEIKAVNEMSPVDIKFNEHIEDKKISQNIFASFGYVENIFDGRKVRFPTWVVEKINGHKGFDTTSIYKSFDVLFKNAIPGWSENEKTEKIKEGHKPHPNIDECHHYVSRIKDKEGTDWFVLFTVTTEKARKGEGESLVHSSFVSEVEVYKAKGADPSSILSVSNRAKSLSAPLADNILSHWFNSVNPSDVSKVVDDNGEPKVVYHGTRSTHAFTTFDGKSFFTDDRKVAEMFHSEAAFVLSIDGREMSLDNASADELARALTSGDYNADEISNWEDFELSEEARAALRDAIETGAIQAGISQEEIDAAHTLKLRKNDNGLFEVFLNIKRPHKVDFGGRVWQSDDDFMANITPEADGVIATNIREGGPVAEIDGEDVPPATDYITFSPTQIKSATDNIGTFDGENENIRYSIVTDNDLLDKLNSEETIKVYRAMQLIDGKLYPPMSARINGKLREPIELDKWEQAEENPDLADDKGYFKLDKANGKAIKARYNPYFHTSPTPLNDQFASAQDRPNLVTVEVEVPKSELTSGYKAEKAKNPVGYLEWKAGVIQSKISGNGKRSVILSRWDKPVRIVPDSEVADKIIEMFGEKKITMPSNVVTPSLRSELEKRGVPFIETDNKGRIVGKDIRLSVNRVTPDEDAAYMDAVRRGDMEKDGDKVGWNYVSFRDDNIRVDHKWTDGQIRFSTAVDDTRDQAAYALAHAIIANGFKLPSAGKIDVLVGMYEVPFERAYVIDKAVKISSATRDGIRQMNKLIGTMDADVQRQIKEYQENRVMSRVKGKIVAAERARAKQAEAAQRAYDAQVRNASGMTYAQMVSSYGIDGNLILNAMQPPPIPEKHSKKDGKKVNDDASQNGKISDEVSDNAVELTEEQINLVKNAVALITSKGKALADKANAEAKRIIDERKKRKEEREAEKRAKSESADTNDSDDANDTDANEDEDEFDKDTLVKEAMQKLIIEEIKNAGITLDNPLALVAFIREMTREYIKENPSLIPDFKRDDIFESNVAKAIFASNLAEFARKVARGYSPSYARLRVERNVRDLDAENISTMKQIERVAENIFLDLNKDIIRQSRNEMMKELHKGKRNKTDPSKSWVGIDSLAKKHTANMKEGDRKVSAFVGNYLKILKRIVDYSAIEAENRAEELENLCDTFSNADDPERYIAFKSAILELDMLSTYGALRTKMPAEIREAVDKIKEFVNGDLVKLAEKQEALKNAIDSMSSAMTGGIVGNPKNKGVEPDSSKKKGLLYSLCGMLEVRAKLLTTYCRDVAKRRESLAAFAELERIMFASTTKERSFIDRAKERMRNVIDNLFGNGQTLEKLLDTAVDESVARTLDRGDQHTMWRIGNVMQMYVSVVQSDYADNVATYKRDGDYAKQLEGIIESADPRLLKLIDAMRNEFRIMGQELSNEIYAHSGVPMLTPNQIYMPVEIKRKMSGKNADARAFSPYAPSLTPRRKHGLDFDQSADIMAVWIDRVRQSAHTIGWLQTSELIQGVAQGERVLSAIRKAHGKDAANQWNDYIYTVLVGKRTTGIASVRLLSFIPTVTSRLFLWGNIGSSLNQLPAIFTSALSREMGGMREVGKSLAMWTLKPHEMWQVARDLVSTEAFKSRYGSSLNAAIENADREGKYGILQSGAQKVFDIGMAAIPLMDKASILLLANVYRIERTRLENAGVPPNEASERAGEKIIRIADKTAQGTTTMNASDLQNKGDVVHKMLMQFQTAPLQQLQFEYAAFIDWKNDPSNGEKAKALLQSVIINHVITPAVMVAIQAILQLIRGQGDDEEEWKTLIQRSIASVIAGPLGAIFVYGAIVDTGATLISKLIVGDRVSTNDLNISSIASDTGLSMMTRIIYKICKSGAGIVDAMNGESAQTIKEAFVDFAKRVGDITWIGRQYSKATKDKNGGSRSSSMAVRRDSPSRSTRRRDF